MKRPSEWSEVISRLVLEEAQPLVQPDRATAPTEAHPVVEGGASSSERFVRRRPAPIALARARTRGNNGRSRRHIAAHEFAVDQRARAPPAVGRVDLAAPADVDQRGLESAALRERDEVLGLGLGEEAVAREREFVAVAGHRHAFGDERPRLRVAMEVDFAWACFARGGEVARRQRAPTVAQGGDDGRSEAPHLFHSSRGSRSWYSSRGRYEMCCVSLSRLAPGNRRVTRRRGLVVGAPLGVRVFRRWMAAASSSAGSRAASAGSSRGRRWRRRRRRRRGRRRGRAGQLLRQLGALLLDQARPRILDEGALANRVRPLPGALRRPYLLHAVAPALAVAPPRRRALANLHAAPRLHSQRRNRCTSRRRRRARRVVAARPPRPRPPCPFRPNEVGKPIGIGIGIGMSVMGAACCIATAPGEGTARQPAESGPASLDDRQRPLFLVRIGLPRLGFLGLHRVATMNNAVRARAAALGVRSSKRGLLARSRSSSSR